MIWSNRFLWITRWSKWRRKEGRGIIKSQYELRYGFPSPWRLVTGIIKIKPDVLLVKDITTVYSLMALGIGFLLGKKMIVMTQIPKHRRQRRSGSVKWLWRLFGSYAITPVLGEEKFPNDNHNLIYLPFVAPTESSGRLGLGSSEKIVILGVGKFQARKNQLLLLQVVKQLKSDFSLKLWLVGQDDEDDYLSKINTYVKDHSLGDVVEIFRNVEWSEMAGFYKNSDIFVLPSFKEAAAYSLVEAMSYGLVVLSSNDNGTKCYVKEGVNGFIFDPLEPADLADKLKGVMIDKERLLNMKQKSLAVAKEEHSPIKFYQKVMEIINL